MEQYKAAISGDEFDDSGGELLVTKGGGEVREETMPSWMHFWKDWFQSKMLRLRFMWRKGAGKKAP